jgi:hypothetical protein
LLATSRKTTTPAVGLGEELDPGGVHALVSCVEVIDAEEEADPTGVLVMAGLVPPPSAYRTPASSLKVHSRPERHAGS